MDDLLRILVYAINTVDGNLNSADNVSKKINFFKSQNEL